MQKVHYTPPLFSSKGRRDVIESDYGTCIHMYMYMYMSQLYSVTNTARPTVEVLVHGSTLVHVHTSICYAFTMYMHMHSGVQ